MRVLAIAVLMAFAPIMGTAQDIPPPKAGSYVLDLGHSRLIFRVSHLGFSNYTALFTTFDATLDFDPDAPESMALEVTVDVASLETHYPDPAVDFNTVVTGTEFLNSAAFPTITFKSTGIALTGDRTADVTGDLTFHGVTKPVTLAVSYNGGWGRVPFDPMGARIGFSATGSILRSEFGVTNGIPTPEFTLGVADRVDLVIEAEFSDPEALAP